MTEKRVKAVTFEIVRCANASPCKQRCLLIQLPDGTSRRLTGGCDGPYAVVTAYRVRRDALLEALNGPLDSDEAPPAGGTKGA